MNNNDNKALPSGLRGDFESWLKGYWTHGLDTSWMPEHAAYVVEEVQTAWSAYQAAHNAQQAEIDRLMLEHCPDEMTAEQVRIWGDSQRRSEEDPCNHTFRYAGNGIVRCIYCEEINEGASDCGSDV